MSKNSYRGWVVLGPGLTDNFGDARVAAASDEHGVEGAGAYKTKFSKVSVLEYLPYRDTIWGNFDRS